MPRFSLQDVNTIECDDEATHEQEVLALQRAINGGLWGLQGGYGRAMMAAIEAGDCLLGPNEARDYWGNRIPSRTAVKQGTKGSTEFVIAAHNAAWVAMLEAA
jgi:hypothetical protein